MMGKDYKPGCVEIIKGEGEKTMVKIKYTLEYDPLKYM